MILFVAAYLVAALAASGASRLDTPDSRLDTPDDLPDGDGDSHFTPRYCETVYAYNPALLNWYTARRVCESAMSRLAIVSSWPQNQYLSARFKRRIGKRGMWLGGNDRLREGHWTWEDGRNMYFTNWYRNQPNNYPRDSNCLEMRARGYWNDADCAKLKPSLCEYQVCAYPLVESDNATTSGAGSVIDALETDGSPATTAASVLGADGIFKAALDPGTTAASSNATTDPAATSSDAATVSKNASSESRPSDLNFALRDVLRSKSKLPSIQFNATFAERDGGFDGEEARNGDATANRDDDAIVANERDNGSGDKGSGDKGSGDKGSGDKGSGDKGSGDKGSGDNGSGDNGSGVPQSENRPEPDRESEREPVTPTSPEAEDAVGKPVTTSSILAALLGLIEHLQRQRVPCKSLPRTNGEWVCNRRRFPWLCMLNCGDGELSGDGVVSHGKINVGDGVIVCDNGVWSRRDYFCA